MGRGALLPRIFAAENIAIQELGSDYWWTILWAVSYLAVIWFPNSISVGCGIGVCGLVEEEFQCKELVFIIQAHM